MRKTGWILLSVFALATGFMPIGAHAGSISSDECGDVRLDVPGGSMEHVPVTDQRSLNICYAHVASQMTDAYRFSHGDEDYDHLTYPAAAAVLSAEKLGKNTVELGEACQTIYALKKYGSCRRPYSTRARGMAAVNCQIDGSDVASESRRLEKMLNPIVQGSSSRPYVPSLVSTVCPAPNQDPLLETCTLNMRENVEASCSKSGAVKSLPDVGCGGRGFHTSPDSAVIKALQSHFNGSEPLQPMAIEYCSQILKDASYNGQKSASEDRSQSKFTDECRGKHGHVSMVIGRRWNTQTNSCQFLVRNSWGTSCHYYDKKWSCEDGNVWVDADPLAANVYGVQYVK